MGEAYEKQITAQWSWREQPAKRGLLKYCLCQHENERSSDCNSNAESWACRDGFSDKKVYYTAMADARSSVLPGIRDAIKKKCEECLEHFCVVPQDYDREAYDKLQKLQKAEETMRRAVAMRRAKKELAALKAEKAAKGEEKLAQQKA